MNEHFGHNVAEAGNHSRSMDDPDGDGSNNLEEYLAGTDPHDADSKLSITRSSVAGRDGWLVWKTAGNRKYVIQASSQVGLQAQFKDISPVFSVPTDTKTMVGFLQNQEISTNSNRFYRIRIEP